MMMKTIQTLMAVACLLSASVLFGQERLFDVSFSIDTIDCNSRQICYNTQVRSGDGTAWNLAGQNYRIFYDASMASYIDGSAERILPASQYSDILLTADFQNVDASGFPGDLPFKATLGFLNYSVDLMNLTNGGIDLPADGDYMPTTKLCFEVTQEVIDNGSECLGLVWAQMGKTDGIATAFVEISEWVQPNVTTPSVGRIFDDLDAEDGDPSCISMICGGEGNENTDTTCSDGEDNDGDGLVDCADPDCANTEPCAEPPKQFGVALALKSIDCSTGMACYNVNVSTANDESYTLGSQRYQLFYNSAVGSFVSGTSALGSEFRDLALQASTPIENVNAAGIGDLPYEGDLGFINFTILLDDPAVSSVFVDPGFPVTTAELCFVISDPTITGTDVCFESTWAREGVTNPYNGSMVEIDALINTAAQAATPTDFGDLSPASGDDACFDTSCPAIASETGDIDCNDNVDNDQDGLIDCLDPDCEAFSNCSTVCNAQAPVLTGETGVAGTCDYVNGRVELTVDGGNQTTLYTTAYVLTSIDGLIMGINNNAASFELFEEGYYRVYAINYRPTTVTLTGLSVGGNIGDVTGDDDCFAQSAPFDFSVCSEVAKCNFCLGEDVTINVTATPGAGRTSSVVLTDNEGVIISIGDETNFGNLDAAIYVGHFIEFETGQTVDGLEVGQNIGDITPGAITVLETFNIGVCDQLSPTIFFDLKGCDITTTAILQVGETFTTYEWNTGSTESFIEVSATEVASYSVTVTLDNGCIGVVSQDITGEEIAQFGDFVWEDLNGNGRQDANEGGINGVTVNLYTDFDNDGSPDFADFPSCITTTGNHPTTGQPGYYNFNVYNSNYIIGFDSPTGFVPTTQNQGDAAGDSDIGDNGLTSTLTIEEGESRLDVDAGFRTSTSVGGLVWEDVDGDGRRDETEVGVNDVTVNLYNADGDRVATTVSLINPETDEPGFYCFDNIPVADYYVEIVLPDGKALTEPNVSNDENRDSDGTGANGPGTTDFISTSPGVKTSDVGFGIYTGGTTCGVVWKESERGTEGVYDEGVDEVVANSQVELVSSDNDQVVQVGATGDDGRYCIDGIRAGSYYVRFKANENGESYVAPNQGGDPLTDSDVDNNTGLTGVFFVGPQDSIQGINAGIRLEALPIELLSFSGSWDAIRSANVLTWVTATEINNDFFEVERIVNSNGDWAVVGTVDGNGTTTIINEYSFADDNVNRSGTYYYRLKQVDYDGGYDYSNIIAIDVLLNNQPSLKVFPNPVRQNAQLDLMVKQDDVATIKVTDLLGREVRSSKSYDVYSGHNMIDVDCADLQSGSYIVLVTIGTSQQYKLIQVAR